MMFPPSVRSLVSVGAVSLLAACFSSTPPAPPVRWFDPTPRDLPPAPGGLPALRLRVVVPPHLGRELVYRIGEREFVFDADHRWIAEPSALLQGALARGLGSGAEAGSLELVVELERFEFDVVDAPRARVQCLLRGSLPGFRPQRVESVQSASSRAVDALVTAMALALADTTAQVQRAVASGR